mmetsp:Transcript_6171/g.13566  ORF Transcript_6171/g.13566 Transcript_6171/m.13566 type:complete len:784 (-) Transcript_6171:863-3214(-)
MMATMSSGDIPPETSARDGDAHGDGDGGGDAGGGDAAPPASVADLLEEVAEDPPVSDQRKTNPPSPWQAGNNNNDDDDDDAKVSDTSEKDGDGGDEDAVITENDASVTFDLSASKNHHADGADEVMDLDAQKTSSSTSTMGGATTASSSACPNNDVDDDDDDDDLKLVAEEEQDGREAEEEEGGDDEDDDGEEVDLMVGQAATGGVDNDKSSASSPERRSSVMVRASSDGNGIGTESVLRARRESMTDTGIGTVQAALDAAEAAGGTDPTGSNISPIFGPAIGTLVAKHLCKHDNKNGTLYLATKACCFHSTFLGFEQSRRVVPLATVSAVLHMNDNGIIVKDESGETYEFTFQADRDACFNLLLSLHGRVSIYKLNRNQEDHDVEGSKNEQPQERSSDSMLRRSLSMPVSKSPLKTDGGTGGGIGDSGGDATEDDYLAACTVANMADDEAQSKRSLVKEITEGKITIAGWATAKKYGASDEASSEDLRENWIKYRDAKNPTYGEKVIDGFRLACTMDEYFDLFLANDADKYGYGAYQRKLGDSELDVTPWHLSEKDGVSLCRKVSYVHPVNAPMAPPSAAASKQQRFRRFGSHGMSIETRTEVKDIPMTDCFHVDDQLLVEPTPDGGVSLTGRFEIRFIKRTMFRSIIANTTNGEFVSWFQGYKLMLIEALKGREGSVERGTSEAEEGGVERVGGSVPVTPTKSEVVTKAETTFLPTKSELYVLVLVVLVALLVVLQFMLMLQMRASNQAYLQMSANQDRLYDMLAQILESASTSSCDSTCV